MLCWWISGLHALNTVYLVWSNKMLFKKALQCFYIYLTLDVILFGVLTFEITCLQSVLLIKLEGWSKAFQFRGVFTCWFCLWQVQLLPFAWDSELPACMPWSAWYQHRLGLSPPSLAGTVSHPSIKREMFQYGCWYVCVMGKSHDATWFPGIFHDLEEGCVCPIAAYQCFAVFGSSNA